MNFSGRTTFLFAVFCCLLTFSLKAEASISAEKFPLKEISEYTREGDTNNLSAALWYINQNYSRFHGTTLLKTLQDAEQHSEATDLYGLYGFYSLTRRYYEAERNSSKAMEYSLKCYNLLKNEPESSRLYWLMIDIGNIFYGIRDFNQAQVFYEKSIGIANRLKESYGMSVIYLNLGLVADQKKEYEVALNYYKLSAAYRVTSGNSKFTSSTYTNIANTFFKMEQPDSAKFYIDQAKYYYESFGNETDLLVEVPPSLDLGYYQYYAAKKDFGKADDYLRKVKAYTHKNNLTGAYIASFFVESSYLVKGGKYGKAATALEEILPLVKVKNLIFNEKDIYKSLSQCYTKLQQYEKAAAFFKKYLAIEDSIEHISLQTQFNTIRAITEVHESEVKLNQLKKDIEIARLNNEMDKKETKFSYNLAAAAISGFLILCFLLWQIVQRGQKLKKLQSKLREQTNNIKIQSNELRKSIQVKDKIFSVIAHDLRNPLNRLLVELALLKQVVPSAKSGIAEAMENTLKETIDLFERLLQWSKRDNKNIVYSPSIINMSESINKIISFYLSEIQTHKIAVVNNCSTLNAFVDANVLLTLLRNILGNAIKAVGNSGTIEVQCEHLNEDQIQIAFFDSGSGFSQYILDEFNNESKMESVGEGTGLMLCKTLAKYNNWPINLSNDSDYGGAKITLIIPAYRKKRDKQQEDASKLENIELSESVKLQLQPVKGFKLYQTSELRNFLHGIQTDDPQANTWISKALQVIHEGNNEAFQKLLKML